MTSNIISYAAAFSVLVVVVAMGLLAAACLSSNLAANKSRDAAALDAAVSHLFADITRAPGGHIVCVAADALSGNPGDIVEATAACVARPAREMPCTALFGSLSPLGPDRSKLLAAFGRVDGRPRWEPFLSEAANGLPVSGLYSPEWTVALDSVDDEPTALLTRVEFTSSADSDLLGGLVATFDDFLGIGLDADEADQILQGNGFATGETAEACGVRHADGVTPITVVLEGVPCR